MVEVSEAIAANHLAFVKIFSEAIDGNIKEFSGKEPIIESYARISAVNAVKVDLIELYFSKESAYFFFEAHNDLVISHVNASFGCWRPALQALRSFMENTLSAIYYAEHPVELEKWRQGDFYIQPKDLREYVATHPKSRELARAINLKDLLDREYSVLSKAVHASNSLFRMTSSDGKISITKPNITDLGKWAARERSTVNLCITVIASIMRDHLEGAKQSNLRRTLNIAVNSNCRSALRRHCGIIIAAP